MRLTTVTALLFMFSLPALAQSDCTTFDNLLIEALQGKMTPVLSALDTLDDAALGPKRAAQRQALIRRFRTKDEHYDFKTTDTSIIDIMRIYQRYWTDVLLDGDVKEHDTGLAFRVGEHLRTHVPALRTKKPSWLMKHWSEELEKELKAHGCYAALGKTRSVLRSVAAPARE